MCTRNRVQGIPGILDPAISLRTAPWHVCTTADEVILFVILGGEAGPDHLEALRDVGKVGAIIYGGSPALLNQLHQCDRNLLTKPAHPCSRICSAFIPYTMPLDLAVQPQVGCKGAHSFKLQVSHSIQRVLPMFH